MIQTLKKNWKLFFRSPPGSRFKDFHDRRKSQKGKGPGGKLLMIIGLIITLLGLALLPLPGPGSIILVPGLMLLAAESMTVARFLDGCDEKRASLMAEARRLCDRLGPLKCLLLGICAGGLLVAGGIGLWTWLT